MSTFYVREPDSPTGYAIDQGESFWSVCVPEASENLFADPTIETQSRTVTTELYMEFDAAAAGAYTFTCYVKMLTASSISLCTDINTPIYTVTRTVKDHTRWTRLEATFSVPSANTYGIKLGPVTYVGAGAETCWWQIEAKGYSTTYFDGSYSMWHPYAASEYYWTGTPYASTSVRTDKTRSGGRWVNLDTLGFRTMSTSGVGPVRYEYNFGSNLGGSHYLESSRPSMREFMIAGNIYGCSFDDLASNRARLVELFRPDILGRVEPIRLMIEMGGTLPERELFAYMTEGLEGEITNRHQQAYALRLQTAEEGSFFAMGGDVVASPPATGDVIFAGRDGDGVWTKYDYDDNGQTFPRIIRAIDHDGRGDIYIGGTIAGYVHKVRVEGTLGDTMLGTDWNNAAVTDAGPIDIAVSKSFPLYVMAVGNMVRDILTVDGAAIWDDVSGEWSDANSGPNITCCVWANGSFYVGGTATVGTHLGAARYDPINDIWHPLGGGFDGGFTNDVTAMSAGPDGFIYMVGKFGDLLGLYGLCRYDPVADRLEMLSRVVGTVTFLRTDNYYDIAFDQQGRMFVAHYIEEDAIDDRSIYLGRGFQFEQRRLYSRTTATEHTVEIEGADSNLYVSGFLSSMGTEQSYPRVNAIHRMWSAYGAQALTPFDFLYPIASEPEYVPIHVIRDNLYFGPNLSAGYKYGSPTTISYTGTAPTRMRLLITGPITLYSVWNWTTKKQIVLSYPITVPENSKVAVFTQGGVLFYLDLSDTSKSPQPVSLNPAASNSTALDLVPGLNSITVFYETGELIYNPQVQISWRDGFNGI